LLTQPVTASRKTFPCPLSCPLCEHTHEDDWPVIFACNVSVQARHVEGLKQYLAHRAGSAREAIMAICSSETKEIAGAFAMLV
jgi:hypothetical protein